MKDIAESKYNKVLEYLLKDEVTSSSDKMSFYDLINMLNEDYFEMNYKLYKEINLEESINEICHLDKHERVKVFYDIKNDKLDIIIDFINKYNCAESFVVSKKIGDDKMFFEIPPKKSKEQDILITHYNSILEAFAVLEDYYYLFNNYTNLNVEDDYFSAVISFDNYLGITGYINDSSNEDKRSLPFNSKVIGRPFCFTDKILKRMPINISELPEVYKLLIIEHNKKEDNKLKVKK